MNWLSLDMQAYLTFDLLALPLKYIRGNKKILEKCVGQDRVAVAKENEINVQQ